jgi:excisionase family DNA binding protein
MARGELRLVYSVTEAAELLGISRSTAYELVARGELPTVRLGRRLIVTRPALTALLGVEPPLPHDLDHTRRALNASPEPARPPQQAALPSAR